MYSLFRCGTRALCRRLRINVCWCKIRKPSGQQYSVHVNYINKRVRARGKHLRHCEPELKNTSWTMVYLFVCVEVLRFSQPNGVMSSAVSLPNHTFTGQSVNQYCAHSFARNWQLPFSNQRKGENDRKKYFMINLLEPAISWSPVGRASNWATEAGIINSGFTSLSTIFQSYLDGVSMWAGRSVLTFRVLPHWNITPQTFDMIFHQVTLYWHRVDQFWFLALLS